MLKKRIIPVLLYNNSLQCLQTKNYKRPARSVGTLMQYIKTMESRNIDEIVLLDIDATRDKRAPLFEQIREFTKELYCPCTIGGGIRSLEDISKLLSSGADKIILGQKATSLIKEASLKFGRQCIVVSTEIELHAPISSLSTWVKTIEDQGAGEILLNSINQNGTRKGYDLDAIYNVSRSVSIPVIANCGCGSPLDMLDAFRAGAHAVAASSMFLFTEHTPRTCAEFLSEHNIPMRIENGQ